MANRLRRVRDVVDGVGSAPVDRMSTLAFSLLPALGERARRHASANVSTVRAFLDAHPQLRPLVPLDATITFPRIDALADASDFAARAARDFDVTVIPGRFFSLPSHVRISVAGPSDNLSGGLAHLAAALATV